MKNKACALEALRNCEGLGTGSAFDGMGRPNCALGVISAACGFKSTGPNHGSGLLAWWSDEFSVRCQEIFNPNDLFKGTPEERRDYMIRVVEGL